MKKIIILLLFPLLILTGCDDKEYDEEAPPGISVKHINDDPNYRPGENVPPPTLAEGQILVVRLIYEINEKDENNDEWYQVELLRNDSKWHDLVKIEGIGRSKFRHWDDYVFSANNFNWQIEKDYYGTDTLDGIYTLKITGSNGFLADYLLNWKEGRWTNTRPGMDFYVP